MVWLTLVSRTAKEQNRTSTPPAACCNWVDWFRSLQFSSYDVNEALVDNRRACCNAACSIEALPRDRASTIPRRCAQHDCQASKVDIAHTMPHAITIKLSLIMSAATKPAALVFVLSCNMKLMRVIIRSSLYAFTVTV